MRNGGARSLQQGEATVVVALKALRRRVGEENGFRSCGGVPILIGGLLKTEFLIDALSVKENLGLCEFAPKPYGVEPAFQVVVEVLIVIVGEVKSHRRSFNRLPESPFLKASVRLENHSPILSLATCVQDDKFRMDSKYGNESNTEFSDFGKVVFLCTAKEASESIVDDVLGHSLAVVMDAQKDLVSLRVFINGHLDLGRPGVEAILNKLPEERKRLRELSYQLFECVV